MKKLAVVFLTISMMAMLVDSSAVSIIVENEGGGASSFKAESPQASGSSFLIEQAGGGAVSLSAESPQTALVSGAFEAEAGGAGSFSIALFDGSSALEMLYAQYYFLTH